MTLTLHYKNGRATFQNLANEKTEKALVKFIKQMARAKIEFEAVFNSGEYPETIIEIYND